jgi:hypothetical protein
MLFLTMASEMGACLLYIKGFYRGAPWNDDREPFVHLAFPLLVSVIRPDASRRVVVNLPLPWACSVAVILPEASRNVVRDGLPWLGFDGLVAEVPVI